MNNKKLLFLFLFLINVLMSKATDFMVESESFSNLGGWSVDQQFMDWMGSPYLLAHGMGKPVADATTTVNINVPGVYYVYVRTYNWTSPWTKTKGPGKFQITINGKTLPKILGDEGKHWMWQKVGQVKLSSGEVSIGIHDLTGFEGRCDAIYFTTSANYKPSNKLALTQKLRNRFLPQHSDTLLYDFVVVGGGIAGMCAAASAARLGSKVALINDRPVLGGNNSSEVRVHLGGIINLGLYKSLGRMIREFGQSRGGNAQKADFYEDAKKDSFIRAEKNIDLFLNNHATAVTMNGDKITSVTILNVISNKRTVIMGHVFSDCTGDANLGYLAGADYRMGREGRSEFGESIAPIHPDSLVMGSSIQWYSKEERHPTIFPEFSYGVKFDKNNSEYVKKGEWTWETGMNRNQVTEAERIRDYGLLVIYANWSFLKNHYKHNSNYRNSSLDWVAYVLGKRESRRLMGDYVLSQDDIDKNVNHEDASFTTSWAIDLHFADSINSVHFPGNEFKTRTIHRWIYPYAVPYRCLYSRNVNNLFMAGRDISCTHVALGTVRVMRTTGMMGEVVGMAAALCKEHRCDPRDIYRLYLNELKDLMKKGTGKKIVPDNQHFNEPNRLLKVPRFFLNYNKK